MKCSTLSLDAGPMDGTDGANVAALRTTTSSPVAIHAHRARRGIGGEVCMGLIPDAGRGGPPVL
jgi:hypothetical protein